MHYPPRNNLKNDGTGRQSFPFGTVYVQGQSLKLQLGTRKGWHSEKLEDCQATYREVICSIIWDQKSWDDFVNTYCTTFMRRFKWIFTFQLKTSVIASDSVMVCLRKSSSKRRDTSCFTFDFFRRTKETDSKSRLLMRYQNWRIRRIKGAFHSPMSGIPFWA